MKTLQVMAPTEFAILDLPTPSPGPGEVLLRIEAVTTCPQWDLHLRHNEPMFVGHSFHYPYTPGQPGHEATGEIAALGKGVAGLGVGQRVSAWRDQGQDRPGCYAQFALLDAENVIPVPVELKPEATASLELAMCVGTVFRMLVEMDVLRGRVVGVTGLGPAGLIAVQMARAEGAAQVIGLDPLACRREYAESLELGPDATFDPIGQADAFAKRPSGTTFETAIDCVGAKTSVEFLMDCTSDVVALFGVQREDYTFSVRHYRDLRLCGYRGHHRESAEYALDLIRQGKLDLASLCTHHLPLEAYDQALELLESKEAIKVCFWPWREE